MDRCVEHRLDAEQFQIGGAEFSDLFVAARCASADVAALFEPGSTINRPYARPSDATTSGLASNKRR